MSTDLSDKLVRITSPVIAPLAPSQDTTSDQLNSFYRPSAIPFVRHSPLPVASQAPSGAAGKSISQTTAGKVVFGSQTNLNQVTAGAIQKNASLNLVGSTRAYNAIASTYQLNSSLNNNPLNVAALVTGTSAVLSQSGTSTTILIAANTWQLGTGTISYNSGSANPGAYGQYVVYFDDPNFLGGTVTYQFSTVGTTITAKDGRFFVGSITTAPGGGGSGGGGNDNPCFLPNVKVKGGREISAVKQGDSVITKHGYRIVKEVFIREYDGLIYHMGNDEWATERHHFIVGNVLKEAHEFWTDRKWYKGKVWNLEIATELEDERNYFLENGMLSHNFRPVGPC